jgi:hypothetical protein
MTSEAVERHERTGARVTTTLQTTTPRPAPSVAVVLADQKADQTIDRSGNIQRTTPPQAIVPVTPAPISEAALERNLAEEAGPGGRLCAHNLQEGHLRTLDDNNVIQEPWRVTAHLTQYRRGFIMFGDERPTVWDRGIMEDAAPFQRDELPHRDPSLWPISDFTGKPDDPVKSQVTFPVVTCDDAAAVFVYVARGPVAENAARSLLGAWRYHPKRKQGLIPIVEISTGTYYSKRFKADRPKPVFKIVDWTTPDGVTPAPAPLTLADQMSDEIPF